MEPILTKLVLADHPGRMGSCGRTVWGQLFFLSLFCHYIFYLFYYLIPTRAHSKPAIELSERQNYWKQAVYYIISDKKTALFLPHFNPGWIFFLFPIAFFDLGNNVPFWENSISWNIFSAHRSIFYILKLIYLYYMVSYCI